MIPKTRTQNHALLQEASSLLLVTALCGAGGALTTTANAAIVSSPGISPATPAVVPNTSAGLYVNVATGVNSSTPGLVPGWDLNPFSSTTLNFWTGAPISNHVMRLPGDVAGPPDNLPLGTSVSVAGSFTNGAVTVGGAAGDWALNASNYFGFQFNNEGTGQVHFGWGRMDVGAAITTRSIAELYYEDTPGAAILVGATVPEPTGAFLAAGAVGLMALRRRRQAA